MPTTTTMTTATPHFNRTSIDAHATYHRFHAQQLQHTFTTWFVVYHYFRFAINIYYYYIEVVVGVGYYIPGIRSPWLVHLTIFAILL